MTTVQPASNAGASLMTTRLIGKFHGAISAQTPTGSRFTTVSLTPSGKARTSSRSRYSARPAKWRRIEAALAAARDVSATGEPFSSVFVTPRSWARASTSSAMRVSSTARADGESARHSVNAARAAATASSTSARSAIGTLPQTSPVAGSTTSIVPLPREGRRSPPMMWSVTCVYGRACAAARWRATIASTSSAAAGAVPAAGAAPFTRAAPS